MICLENIWVLVIITLLVIGAYSQVVIDEKACITVVNGEHNFILVTAHLNLVTGVHRLLFQ